jgi:hypothetical protein
MDTLYATFEDAQLAKVAAAALLEQGLAEHHLSAGATGFLVVQGIPRSVAVLLDDAVNHGGAILAVSLSRDEHLVPARETLMRHQASSLTLYTAAEPAGRIIA